MANPLLNDKVLAEANKVGWGAPDPASRNTPLSLSFVIKILTVELPERSTTSSKISSSTAFLVAKTISPSATKRA